MATSERIDRSSIARRRDAGQRLLFTQRKVCAAGVLLLMGGLLDAPGRAFRVLSADGILEEATLLEARAVRGGLVAAGTACLLLLSLAPFGPPGPEDTRAAPPPAASSSFDRAWAGVATVVCLCLVQTMAWSHRFPDQGWYRELADESGLWETFTALCLFSSGVLMLARAVRAGPSRSSTSRRAAAALFGVVLLFGAGEEVSWGQHWLGFETPELLRERNVQNEFNFHNLGGYWANHVLAGGCLLYFGVLPFLIRRYADVSAVARRLGLPVPAVLWVPFGLAGVLMDEHALVAGLWGSPAWRLSEAREALFSVLALGSVVRGRDDARPGGA